MCFLLCSARGDALRAFLGEKPPRLARFASRPRFAFSVRSAHCCCRKYHREESRRRFHRLRYAASTSQARPRCSSAPSTACRSGVYRELRLALDAGAAAPGYPPPVPQGSAVLASELLPLSELSKKEKPLPRDGFGKSFAQYSSLTRKILNCKRLVWADVGSCGSSERNR